MCLFLFIYIYLYISFLWAKANVYGQYFYQSTQSICLHVISKVQYLKTYHENLIVNQFNN